ncbi:hypothetical protein V502_09535 [Pseudogymnoascus sp. VKM F-4520 (FW-2644)]|nr:hypothetical protein V502_09535 [Pseudogymnoascus sp. VKM F-4520 (FW-2644)]
MSASAAHVATSSCLEAFGALRSHLQAAKPDLAAQVPDADIEDEFGRFRLWAANIGALSRGHGSLDYRLRDAPVVLEGALKLLNELQQELHQMCVVLSGERLPYEAQISSRAGHVDDSDTSSLSSDSESSSDSSSDSGDEKLAPSELRRRVSALSNINDNLYRLSRSIRAPASHSRSLKALSYKLIDKETGVDVVQQFAPVDLAFTKDLFSQLRRNAQDQYENFPTLGDADLAMIKRLAQGITRRRQQFLYWKHHRKKLGFNAEREILKVPKPAPTVQLKGDKTGESVVAPRASLPVIGKAQTESSRPKTTVTETTATLFIAPTTVPDGNQSVTSYATTARGLDGSRIEFPKLPKSIKKGKDFECPYCQMICPPHYQMPRAWRAHLLRDLRPYMCTYEHCQQSDEHFATKQDWVNHEHTHQKAWQCPEHASAHFTTQDGLKKHLFAETHETLQRMGLEDLLAICETVRPDSRTICPICFVEASSSYGLENHLANHLERFAAFALPRDVEGDADEESPNNSNMSEHAIERSDQSEVSDLSYAFAGEDKKAEAEELATETMRTMLFSDADANPLDKLYDQITRIVNLPTAVLDKLNIDLQFKAVFKTIPKLLTELREVGVSGIDEDVRECQSELIFQMERLDSILQEYATEYALDSSHPRLGIDTVLSDRSLEDGRKQNQPDGEPTPSRESSPDSVVNRAGPRLTTMDLNRHRTSGSAEEANSPIRDSSPDSIVNRTSSVLSTVDLNRTQTSNPTEDAASPIRDSSPDSMVNRSGPSLSTMDLGGAQSAMAEEEQLLIRMRDVRERNREGDKITEEPPNENMQRNSLPFLIATLSSLLTSAYRIQQRLEEIANEDKDTSNALAILNRIVPGICLAITSLITMLRELREGVPDSSIVPFIESTNTKCKRLIEDAWTFLDNYRKSTRLGIIWGSQKTLGWGSAKRCREDTEQLNASAQHIQREINYIHERYAGGRTLRKHGRDQDEPISPPSIEASTLPTDNVEAKGGFSGEGEYTQRPKSARSQDADNLHIPGLQDGSKVEHETSELSKLIAGQRDSSSLTHHTPPQNLDSNSRIHGRPIIIDERHTRGILKPGRNKFPEDPSPTRKGAPPLGDALSDGIYIRPSRAEGAPPPDARWTKINRLLVNPEALDEGGERYEARDDVVVVLRVLSKEEIQAYADATVRIRAARGIEDEARDERKIKRIPPPSPMPEQDGSDGDDEGNDSGYKLSHKRRVSQLRQTQEESHDHQKEDILYDARWTKIDRKTVSPEALTQAGETFEERDNLVIVKRALSKDEIEAYTVMTEKLRARRRLDVFGDAEDDVAAARRALSTKIDRSSISPGVGADHIGVHSSKIVPNATIQREMNEYNSATEVRPGRSKRSDSLERAAPEQDDLAGYYYGYVRPPNRELAPMKKTMQGGRADGVVDVVVDESRWTKINRRFVSPEALDRAQEKYYVWDHYVIVHRILSREEVDAYTKVSTSIRAARADGKEEDDDRRGRGGIPTPHQEGYEIPPMLPPQLPYDNQEGEANDERGWSVPDSWSGPQQGYHKEGESDSDNERGWSVPDSWPPKTDNMPMSDPHDEEEPHTDDVLGEPLRPSSATSSLFDDDVVLNPHTLRRDSMDTSHHMERANPSPPSATTDKEIYPKRPYPPRAPRELHRPRTLLHRPSPSFRVRASSSTAITTATFPCTFAFAGCASAFASKNEWKRHVSSRHTRFPYWECHIGACSSPGKRLVFSRKDLFAQHLRRIHRHSAVGAELDKKAWESQINVLLVAGERMGRSVIRDIGCPAPGCMEIWRGLRAWDERMEHVARHWEQVARGEKVGGWTEEGGGLLEWALREGAIEEVEGGQLVCREGMGRRAWNDRIGLEARHLDAVSRGEKVWDSTEEGLGAKEPKNPNDETKITYDDASGPRASSIAPSHWNDNVILDPFTFPEGVEYTNEQMTRDEENKSIDDEIFDAPPRTTDPTTHQTTNRGERKLSVKFVSEHQAEPRRPSSVKSMTLDNGSDEVPSDIDIDPPTDDSDADALPQTTNPTAPRRRNSGDRRPVRKPLSLFNYRVADPTLVRYRDPDTKETAHPEPGSHPAPPQPPSAMPSTLDNDGEFPDPPPSRLRGGSRLFSVLYDDEDVFTSVDAALDAEDEAPLDEKQISRLKRVFSRRNWRTEKGKGEQKGKDKEKDKGKGKDKEDDGGGGGRRRSVLGF